MKRFILAMVLTLAVLSAASPRYRPEQIPDTWKADSVFHGPYVQGPDGYYYYVSPFNQTPWLAYSAVVVDPDFEFGYVYGPAPKSSQYADGLSYQAAINEYSQNKSYFKGIKLPDWATKDDLAAANQVFSAWDLGQAVVFEGRYGFSVRFPASLNPKFEIGAETALRYPHLVVAIFQVEELSAGRVPAKRHPFVPPQLFPGGEPPHSAAVAVTGTP